MMKMTYIGMGLVLGVAVGGARLAEAAGAGGVEWKLVSLGKGPQGRFAKSPDERHVAFISKEGGKKRVYKDGVMQGEFDDVPEAQLTEAGRTESLVFSPDSQHLTYVAKVPTGMAMVLDGKAGDAFEQIGIGRYGFSKDSKHLAFVAGVGKRERVVVDNVQGILFSYVDYLVPGFNQAGEVYYIARDGEQSVLIMDGREVARGESLSNLTFSGDGKRFAYTLNENGKWCVVLDGVKGPGYELVGNNLLFSADGAHFFYTARKGGSDVVVADGKEIDAKGTVREGVYGFDAKGVIAYIVQRDNGWYVIHGDQESGPFENVWGGPIVSADGKHLAFAAAGKTGDDRWMVIDGKPGAHFDYFPGDVQFSADGAHTYYQGRRGEQQFVVVDGQETKVDSVLESLFSPDGKHSAVSARRGDKFYVLMDGKEGPMAESTYGIVFSADSQHMAYLAHTGPDNAGSDALWVDGKEVVKGDEIGQLEYTDGGRLVTRVRRGKEWKIWVDGEESPGFDALGFGAGRVGVDSPTTVHALGMIDGQVVRVEGSFK